MAYPEDTLSTLPQYAEGASFDVLVYGAPGKTMELSWDYKQTQHSSSREHTNISYLWRISQENMATAEENRKYERFVIRVNDSCLSFGFNIFLSKMN